VELTDTAVAILDAAQELAQTRGYNAFSYRDLAERIGIRTASIHYHFPTKGDLGRALIGRYGAFVAGAVADLERLTTDAPARLRGYSAILEDVLAPPGTGTAGGGRVCLGGMLASEYPTLPPEVQRAVRGFMDDNLRWLARVLAEGRDAGTLAFPGTPEAAATALFSALEGAMLVARTAADVGRYRAASAWLLSALTPVA
jgi:TetR/AcrR family transcriptional regulator, transcriptional repressor for nem operon